MSEFEFNQKKVFVMDGNSPLGKEIISTFIQLEATVLSMSKTRNKQEFTIYCETINNKIKLGTLDLNSPNIVEELTTMLLTHIKSIDVFINNSEKINNKGILELSSNEWEAEIFINLDIPFILLKAIIPLMKESNVGSVINMSSLSAINGGEGEVGFASVKSASESMSKALSRELINLNVRVNCISFSHEDLQKTENQIPKAKQGLIRTVKYEDVVHAILFLSSSLSSYINGQVLLIDGGRTYR